MAKTDKNLQVGTESVNFQSTRGDIVEVYTDTFDAVNKVSRTKTYAAPVYTSAPDFRIALNNAESDTTQIVALSRKLFATNPIYTSLVNYFSNMYLWRYTSILHKLKDGKTTNAAKFDKIYRSMLEIVEGLNLQNILPTLLTQLYIQGSVYFLTSIDEESMTISTIIYPSIYAKRIGQSQFGTGIIQLDMRYFDTLGFTADQLKELFTTFPKIIGKSYNKYKADPTLENRWAIMDGATASCVLLNEKGVPNLIYSFGSIMNYELYGDNELTRNSNALRYIVTHKMPLYEGNPIFNPEEVKQLHSRLSSVVNTSANSKLITTYGEINLIRVGETVSQEDKTLLNAYKSVFNNAGLNDVVFTGDSKEAMVMSITRDKATVWNFVQQIMSFYNIAVNNYIDFKGYQADISMLPISPYTYQADITEYRSNATLGIGKLQFIVASGMNQKNINDQLELEEMLGLNNIKPLQSAYTGSSSSNVEDKKLNAPETPAKETSTNKDPASEPDQASNPLPDEDSPTVRPAAAE